VPRDLEGPWGLSQTDLLLYELFWPAASSLNGCYFRFHGVAAGTLPPADSTTGMPFIFVVSERADDGAFEWEGANAMSCDNACCLAVPGNSDIGLRERHFSSPIIPPQGREPSSSHICRGKA